MRDLATAILILAAVWAAALVALFLVGRKVAAHRLLTFVPNLVTLMRGLLGDDRVPLASKVLLGGALLWILSPVDLVPEFIPVLGPFDDAIVGALVLRHVVRRAGPDVVASHWRGDAQTLAVLLRVAGFWRSRNDRPLPA